MSISTQYYDLASLGEASYVLFDMLDKSDFSNSEKIKAALKNEDLGGAFSDTQATDFVSKYDVLAHQGVPDGLINSLTDSGFSATLFKGKGEGNDNKFYYVIRGTEPGWRDLFKTDVGDIIVDGLAIHQIVDMYNDWQRIKGPKDGIYKGAKLVPLVAETAALALARANLVPGTVSSYELSLQERNDVLIDMPSGIVYTIRTDVDSDQIYSGDRAKGLGIPITGPVTVVGHSMGGHLADAFSRLFSSECTDIFTVNGAGYMTGNTGGLSGNAPSNIRNLFEMLGGADHFVSSKILNLYGDKWIEFTTMDDENCLVQQGGHREIYIESASAKDNSAGHAAEQMTDSHMHEIDDFIMTATQTAVFYPEESQRSIGQ
jgi:hypothetical protein